MTKDTLSRDVFFLYHKEMVDHSARPEGAEKNRRTFKENRSSRWAYCCVIASDPKRRAEESSANRCGIVGYEKFLR